MPGKSPSGIPGLETAGSKMNRTAEELLDSMFKRSWSDKLLEALAVIFGLVILIWILCWIFVLPSLGLFWLLGWLK